MAATCSCVPIRTTDSLVSLFYDPHARAVDGGRGQGKKKYGKSMDAKVVPVPVGTLIYRLPPGQTITRLQPVRPRSRGTLGRAGRCRRKAFAAAELELLADLTQIGQEYLLCKGGARRPWQRALQKQP